MSYIAESQTGLVTSKLTVIGVLNFQYRFHGHYEEFHLSYVILTIFWSKTIQLQHFEHHFHGKTSYLGKMSTKIMELFIDTIF